MVNLIPWGPVTSAENSTANGLSGVARELKEKSCGCHLGTCGLPFVPGFARAASANAIEASPGTAVDAAASEESRRNLRRCMVPFICALVRDGSPLRQFYLAFRKLLGPVSAGILLRTLMANLAKALAAHREVY